MTITVPLVSVIMTVYNAERYVAQAIQSIRRQTMDDFEAIVINDGSTDDSLAVIHREVHDDPRWRVVSRPNTGIVKALNEGLSMAQGEFIARMDADDLCEPNRFELQLRRMQAEPELVVLGSNAIAIDPQGRRLGLAPVPLTHEEIETCHLHGTSSMYHPAVMLRRKAVEDVGAYRERCPAEDYDLWLRLGEVGRLANLPEPLFIWRRTAQGLVAKSSHRQRQMVVAILHEAWQRRGLPGVPDMCAEHVVRVHDMYRQWGWLALQSHEKSTGRRYAAKALLKDPLSLDSWRLAACALRGY